MSKYPAEPKPKFPYRWRTRLQEPDRFGQACRQVAETFRGNGWMAYGIDLNRAHHGAASITVEFEDGTRVKTSRGCIRLKRQRRA